MPNGISIHIGLNEVDATHYRNHQAFPLTGCIRDAHAMYELAAAAGFEPTLITGKDATAQAVVNAITEAGKRVGADGTLLLTFSGHGGRVRDLGDDPLDDDLRDGLDETWYLYDRQLTDDELAGCLAGFPEGSRVLIVSDSCFSGGMIQESCADSATVRADVMLLAAAQENESAKDDDDTHGVFTRALLEVWNKGEFKGNYLDLHEELRDRLVPGQHPYLTALRLPSFIRDRPFTF